MGLGLGLGVRFGLGLGLRLGLGLWLGFDAREIAEVAQLEGILPVQGEAQACE